jgi:hypothetical protein
MPLKGPQAYKDITPLLMSALHRGGCQVDAGSTAAAIKLVQRMNQFRILDRKINHDAACRRELPYVAADREMELSLRNNLYYLKSDFDDLIFKRRDSIVLVEMRGMPYKSVKTLDGEPMQIEPFEIPNPYKEHETKTWTPIASDGTTRPPREKFNPNKPLSLLDDEC